MIKNPHALPFPPVDFLKEERKQFLFGPCSCNLPLFKNPLPFAPAIPTSASLASPGPFTTHPMTATVIASSRPLILLSTFATSFRKTILHLPQVGHETRFK
jgi:hypothetical protein